VAGDAATRTLPTTVTGLPDTAKPDPAHATPPVMHGVLVTCHRPGDLVAMLDGLAQQERRLDTLVIIDNDPGESAREVLAKQVAAGTPGSTAIVDAYRGRMGLTVRPAGNF